MFGSSKERFDGCVCLAVARRDLMAVCVWQWQRDLMVFGSGKERFDGCVCLAVARRDLMVECVWQWQGEI